MAMSSQEKARVDGLVVAELAQEASEQATHRQSNPRFRQRRKQEARQRNGITIWVDEYEGPQGKGYILRSEVTTGGVTYRRGDNVGPEVRQSHDWQEFVEELF